MSGNAARFSGSITGGTPPYTWTLDYGDGTTASGSGSTISGIHDYGKAGTYTATLSAFDAVGFPTSCSVDLQVANTLSLDLQEPVSLGDALASNPSVTLNETLSLNDRITPGVTKLFNETISIIDKMTSPGKILNETVSIIDQVTSASGNLLNESVALHEDVSITKGVGAGPFPGGLLGEIIVGVAVTALAGAAVVWRFVIGRPK